MPEDTVPEQRPAHLFAPGKSGNPAGRPKGSRSKLGEFFIHTLYDDFAKHGADAIVAVREKDPSTYMRVVASILPKELEITRPMADLSDNELANAIELIRATIASTPGSVPTRTEAAPSREPTSALRSLH